MAILVLTRVWVQRRHWEQEQTGAARWMRVLGVAPIATLEAKRA
jgi:hypothetical protein